MTREEVARVLHELQQKEDLLREAGQKEYAHTESNAFGNFERVAEKIRCKNCGENFSREQVLMVYLLKHIDGIIAYVNGYESQRENVEGRILDARVYEALLAGMVRENLAVESEILNEK